ncbi:MAG: translesion DNA synthesis-associated protein ImuA [Burkholderiaceae bacterium]|nr:translesion DNA synthesis-associated protein ImuA [Burkholderiaceae bacterium]
MYRPSPLAVVDSVAAPPAWPHPLVWRADTLPAAHHPVWPTGFAALDACLPGSGWPCGALTEVLQPAGQHLEWQLVLPALAHGLAQALSPGEQASQGWVLVGAPHVPHLQGLRARGLSAAHLASLVSVEAHEPVQRLWACEQALLSPSVAAVLAWLPHAPTQALRRLQQAAQRHGCVLWVFRPLSAQAHATPAVLRLHASAHTCPGWLEVGVLKRRGPPLAQPLQLPSPDLGLQATLAGARWLRAQHRQPSVGTQPTGHSLGHPPTHPTPTLARPSTLPSSLFPSHHALAGTESFA